MKYRSFVEGYMYFQNFMLDIELLTVETITNFCYLFSSCEQQARRRPSYRVSVSMYSMPVS